MQPLSIVRKRDTDGALCEMMSANFLLAPFSSLTLFPLDFGQMHMP